MAYRNAALPVLHGLAERLRNRSARSKPRKQDSKHKSAFKPAERIASIAPHISHNSILKPPPRVRVRLATPPQGQPTRHQSTTAVRPPPSTAPPTPTRPRRRQSTTCGPRCARAQQRGVLGAVRAAPVFHTIDAGADAPPPRATRPPPRSSSSSCGSTASPATATRCGLEAESGAPSAAPPSRGRRSSDSSACARTRRARASPVWRRGTLRARRAHDRGAAETRGAALAFHATAPRRRSPVLASHGATRHSLPSTSTASPARPRRAFTRRSSTGARSPCPPTAGAST